MITQLSGITKNRQGPRVKTRMNDQSWKRKEGNEPCPGLLLKKDKGERIRTKNFAPVIRARGMRSRLESVPSPQQLLAEIWRDLIDLHRSCKGKSQLP